MEINNALIGIKLSLEQISKLFGYSENSFKTKFNRTSQAINKKYGLKVSKVTSYDGVYYIIESKRALTIYEEVKNELYLPIDSIKMDDLMVFILIGVSATEFGVFRGTRKDLLNYLGIVYSKKNIELLNAAIDNLLKLEAEPIIFKEDKDIIILSLKKEFEEYQIVTVKMLKECKRIAEKYNKKSMKVIQLLKVWQAYRINEQKGLNIITDKDLQYYIDLSEKQVRDAKKLLEDENIIKMNRVGTKDKRIGTEFNINAFYDNNIVAVIENEQNNNK